MLANMLLRVMSAPPVLVDDTAETDAATTTNGNVLTNDSGGTLTVSAVNGLSTNVGKIVSGSNGGDFVINADGSWTFDPAGDFAGLSGSDTTLTSVSYHASNGSAEASATLTMTVSSSVSAPWTPAEITTALWLDASDADTIILNGSTVSEWADKSGNARHAVQGTANAQPTRGTNVVIFDGGDLLSFANSTDTDFALKFGTDSFAILAVCNPSAVNRNPNILFGARGYGVGWFFGLSNANTYMRLYNSAEQWSPAPQTSATLTAGVQMLGATAPRGATGRVYKNGTIVQSSSSAVGSQSMANSRPVRIGAYSDESNNPVGFWLGGMHEILLIKGVVSVGDWQKAEGYLTHKWDELLGVTTLVDALPSDHPYKSAPPML